MVDRLGAVGYKMWNSGGSGGRSGLVFRRFGGGSGVSESESEDL